MTTQVCLLRGVNVGGKNRLAMRDLVALFESLGLRDVRTYIQSGNVLFSSGRRISADQLGAAIAERFGLVVPVVLRSADQLTGVLRSNPFAGRDPAALHVGFLEAAPAASPLSGLDPRAWAPEEFATYGTEIYLFLPDGMGRSKLPAHLERRLRIGITFRNWRTVTTLAELSAPA
jgi:uncharacterized protein (DUF1697 family)